MKNHNYGTIAVIMLFWFVISFVTNIIGPLVVGTLVTIFDLRTAMMILTLSLAYIFSLAFWAKPLMTNKTISTNKEPK